jgi:hypothetical protein
MKKKQKTWYLWLDEEREVEQVQELQLQGVHLRRTHAAELGVEGVVVEQVVEELGRQHQAVERRGREIGERRCRERRGKKHQLYDATHGVRQ